MIYGAIYGANGAIDRLCGAPEDAGLSMQCGAGEQYLIVDSSLDMAAFYVVSGELTPKAAFDLTIGRNKISNIPKGTRAIGRGLLEIIDDGEIEFLADVEETIQVSLDHPHYLYENVAVETGP